VSLECIVAEYFDVPAEVVQFQGEWLHLGREGRTVLPSEGDPGGHHNLLGRDAVLGQQVWAVRGCFRIRVGPVDYATYLSFLPGGDALAAVAELARTYVGPDLVFDVVPVLRADAVPHCVLDSFAADPPRLGANVWLRSVPCEQDFDGAAFVPGAAAGFAPA
jgi:type VI secretion system protein ImpH